MGRDGFVSGDFDPAFPLDDKFVRLAAMTADRTTYYEAVGAYWHVVAASWRDGTRRDIRRTAPACSEAAERALIEAGLLDPDGSLPGSSFERWVGAAQQRRMGWAERKRRERESAGLPVTPRESGGQTEPPRSLSEGQAETPPDSAGVRARQAGGRTDKQTDRRTNGPGGGGAGEEAKGCKDPAGHRASWVTIAGVGTRCPACAPTRALPAWGGEPPPPAAKAS